MRHLFFFCKRKTKYRAALGCLLIFISLWGLRLTALAETVDFQAEAEARKELPIQSNEIAGWPEGPQIGAESAILMDDSGVCIHEDS